MPAWLTRQQEPAAPALPRPAPAPPAPSPEVASSVDALFSSLGAHFAPPAATEDAAVAKAKEAAAAIMARFGGRRS